MAKTTHNVGKRTKRNRAKKIRKLIIRQDSDVESPREWSNVGTMVCWHRRYNLGDEQPSNSPSEYMRELAANHVNANDVDLIPDEHIQRILDKHFIILPLYLYDHSGITMSTGRFSCPWDSGQVGWIYCTKAHGIAECGSEENALKNLECEVSTYDDYLTGNVYGFELMEYELDEDDEPIEESEECLDSCWGFYGDDPKKNGIAEHLSDEDKHLLDDPEFRYND